MGVYYRCLTTNRGVEFEETGGGLYEAVDDGGRVITDDRGRTERSAVAEVCCSKSPQAALFAAIQNRMTPGTYYLYVTYDEPDVDLAGETVRDFPVLEEVRFRAASMPIEFYHHAVVDVDRELVTRVRQLYRHGTVTTDRGAQVKAELRALIDAAT
jgi:hypothetical protein